MENKTALQTRTHCVLSLQSIWCSRNSSCCYTIHPQSTLLDATVGLVVFSFWWLQPVCFPTLFAGWLLRMGLCLFLNGFVVHDAIQHYCVMYTRLCGPLCFRALSEKNATCTELTDLPFEWLLRSLYSTHLEETNTYSIVLCMQACSHVLTFLSLLFISYL